MQYRGVYGSERRVSSVLSDERSSLQSGTLPPPRSSSGYADLRKEQEQEYAYRQEHQRDQRSAFDWNSSYGDGVYNNVSRDDSMHVEVIRLINQERNSSNTIPMRGPSIEKIRARMIEQSSYNSTNNHINNNNNINNNNMMRSHNTGVVGTRAGSSNSSRNQLRGGQILDDTFEEIYTEEERVSRNTKAVDHVMGDHYGGGRHDSRYDPYNAGYEKNDYPEEEEDDSYDDEGEDDYDDEEDEDEEEDVPRIPIIGGQVNGKVMRDILYGTPKAGDAYQTRQEVERRSYRKDPPTSYQRDYSMPENDGNREMWSQSGSEMEGPPGRTVHSASAPQHHRNNNNNNHINNNHINERQRHGDVRRMSESSPTHRTWQPRPEKPPASLHVVPTYTHTQVMEPFTAGEQERARRHEKHTVALHYREERIDETMESSHAPFADTADEHTEHLQPRRHTPKRRSDRHAPSTYEEREESQKQQKSKIKKRRQQQSEEYEDHDAYEDAYGNEYMKERYEKNGRRPPLKEKRSPSPEEPSSSSYPAPAAAEEEEEKEESLETGASPKAEKRKKKIKRASSSQETGRKSRSKADVEEPKAKRKHKRKQKTQEEDDDDAVEEEKEEEVEPEVATFTVTESCAPTKTNPQKEEAVKKEKVFCGRCFGGSTKGKEKKKKDAKHSDKQNAITQTQSVNESASPKQKENLPSETAEEEKKKELKTKQEEEEEEEKKEKKKKDKKEKKKKEEEEEEEEYEEEYEEDVEEDLPVDPSLSSTFHSEVDEKVKETTRRNASVRRSANSEWGAWRRHRHLGNSRIENWSDVD